MHPGGAHLLRSATPTLKVVAPPIMDSSYSQDSRNTPALHDPLRVVLVEDQTMFRMAIVQQLALVLPKAVFKEIGTVAELEKIDPLDHDLAIVDLELTDGTALNWIDRVCQLPKPPPVIILSSVDPRNEVLVFRAAHAGVAGFVHKHEPISVLISAVHTVLGGGMYYSPIVNQMRRSQSRPDFYNKILTDREQELLRYIGEGLTSEEIAQIMGLRQNSVND